MFVGDQSVTPAAMPYSMRQRRCSDPSFATRSSRAVVVDDEVELPVECLKNKLCDSVAHANDVLLAELNVVVGFGPIETDQVIGKLVIRLLPANHTKLF